jgi:hypothetical protein
MSTGFLWEGCKCSGCYILTAQLCECYKLTTLYILKG